MSFVYIVVENSDDEPAGGGVYDTVFNTFEEAKAAVIAKFNDMLEYERSQARENGDLASEVNVDVSSGRYTTLYVEKEINIYIHKIPTTPTKPTEPTIPVNVSGGRRRTRRSKSRSLKRKK